MQDLTFHFCNKLYLYRIVLINTELPFHYSDINFFIFFDQMQTGECYMQMVDAEFEYTYEYQGNAAKLVHTPLTDKRYLTLTQGMKMGLGGNPYGPAGTGKTESIKALGGLFGRQVLVFNCDEVNSLTFFGLYFYHMLGHLSLIHI